MYIDLQEYQEFSKPAFTREGLIVQFPRRVTGITRDGSRILLHLQAMVCRKEPVVISALMQGRTFRFTGQWAPMTASLEFLPPRTLRLRLADGEGLPPNPQPMVLSQPGFWSRFSTRRTSALGKGNRISLLSITRFRLLT